MDATWPANLPEPVRSILIGAAGDFLGGMASEVATRLIDAAGYRIKKLFRSEPKQAALNRAMAEALFSTVQGLTDDPGLMAHYLQLFGEWLTTAAVSEELSQIVDPQPETEIDIERLRDAFAALGYDADMLGGSLTFEQVVERFISAFYDAAAGEAELQGQIEIGLLRAIAERTARQVQLLQQMATNLEQAAAQGQSAPGPGPMQIAGDQVLGQGPVATRGSAANTGSGIAQAGSFNLAVTGQVGGDVLGPGASKTVYSGPDPHAEEAAAKEALRCYLERLGRYCQALPLAALGGEETGDQDVTLDQVYIDLDTATRVPLTEAARRERQERARFGPEAETRPLAALEVAAQNTRLALLGEPGAGKSTFVRKLLAWQAAAYLGEDQPPPGYAADWLPILVVLRDLAPRLAGLDLAALSHERQQEVLAGALRDQVLRDLARLDAAACAEPVRRALRDGQCVLVLDGLDEVAPDLRGCIRQAVAAVVRSYAPRRMILTCRVRSYAGDAVLPAFQAHTLAPFDEDHIRQFVLAWYNAQRVLGRLDAEESRRRAANLAAAALAPDLRELAANPMLLTTMAIIHQKEIGLPRERVRLYDLAVDVLLRRWQKRKTGEQEMAPSPALAEFLRDDLRLRTAVERLAYEAQRLAKDRKAASDLTRGQALTILETAEYLGHTALADEFLSYVDQRAGLLMGFGGDTSKPAAYGFPHRTFQEYLAGSYLLSQRGMVREFYARAGEGDYWNLAALLGAEELYHNRRNLNALLDLAYGLGPARAPAADQDRRSLLWSGQMAILAGREAVARDTTSPEGGPAYLERLLPRLVGLLASNLSAPERAEAGRILGKLGDPRPEVMDLQAMPFCLVPGGQFWLGSTRDEDPDAQESEYPQQQMDLPSYYISRYPATNSQYQAFVAAGGYAEARWWSKAAKKAVWHAGQVKAWNDHSPRAGAYDFGEPFNLPNHPVVGVTWYEASAFTRWLTVTWQAQGLLASGWAVRLPTEAEWEKAARGGLQIPAAPFTVPVHAGLNPNQATDLCENPRPRRIYPWGAEKIGPEWANYAGAQVATPATPGTFPKGASPYGALDLSGNVWEWCQTKWRDGYKSPADDRPEGNQMRVLRGGAFSYGAGLVRCAFRDGNHPLNRRDFIGFRVVASPIIHDSGR